MCLVCSDNSTMHRCITVFATKVIQIVSFNHVKPSLMQSPLHVLCFIKAHLLGEFGQAYPHSEPEFQIGHRAEIIQRLEQKLDDLYVFSNPPRELDITTDFQT